MLIEAPNNLTHLVFFLRLEFLIKALLFDRRKIKRCFYYEYSVYRSFSSLIRDCTAHVNEVTGVQCKLYTHSETCDRDSFYFLFFSLSMLVIQSVNYCSATFLQPIFIESDLIVQCTAICSKKKIFISFVHKIVLSGNQWRTVFGTIILQRVNLQI